MKLTAVCFSTAGAEVIKRLRAALPQLKLFGYYKTKEPQPELAPLPEDTNAFFAQCFAEHTPLLFVCACGIAVRMIAPFVKDKFTDSPVIVCAEDASYVIPILSGHVGGANEIAQGIADTLGATCVITTATDVQETFSVDVFAKKGGLNINNRNMVKNISAKALAGQPIRICVTENTEPLPDVLIGKTCADKNVLWLSRKRYVMGIGCKKGKTLSEIEAVVEDVLEKTGITYNDLIAFGSVEQKAEEAGLLSFSAVHRLPFVTVPAATLAKIPGDFTASNFVKDTIGVDNVCERTAVFLTGGCGKLIKQKHATNGVTIALAEIG